MSSRYKKSEEMLKRALETIPLGSQTFSKSITQLPHGVSPYFAERAVGANLFDVDGNRYLDFVNSLLAITLGYQDQDVLDAVHRQLQNGTIFSLGSSLEIEVAELITEMVPCAEMVRFGKNGSDATAGAIRVARAYTGKEHVLVCGYHGWQDWYIAVTTKNLGIPESTKALSHNFPYNDLDKLEELLNQYKDNVAAVIMEPMNITYPEEGYLEKVKALTHAHGALLIFDETITGFRYSNGGAQELFGVTPDLATFGKGLANGYPLSAVAGKSEYMRLMEEVFFSFTFGGELLSLAASKAVLQKLKNKPVVDTIRSTGQYLMERLKNLIKEHSLQHIFDVKGDPVWSFFTIADHELYNSLMLKTLYIQEMMSKGIFIIGTHNLSYAHTREDVDLLMEAYDHYFDLVGKGIKNQDLDKNLDADILKPLFKVR